MRGAEKVIWEIGKEIVCKVVLRGGEAGSTILNVAVRECLIETMTF